MVSRKKLSLLVCRNCTGNIGKSSYKVKCSGECGRWYHLKCTSTSEKIREKIKMGKVDYKCNECKNQMMYSKDKEESSSDSINVSSDSESEVEISDADCNVRMNKSARLSAQPRRKGQSVDAQKNSSARLTMESAGVRKSLDRSVHNFNSVITKNITNHELLKAVEKLTTKVDELQQLVEFNSEIMDIIKKSVENLTQENKNLKKEQIKLKTEITVLQNELSSVKNLKRNYIAREQNLIILGVSTEESEKSAVKKISEKLGVTLEEKEFTSKRLPSKSLSNPILVTFKSKNIRDQILEKRKEFGKLNSEILGLKGSLKTDIFVNEDIEKEVRDLYLKARQLRQHNYRFVWCKDGKVFCRQTINSKVILINNENKIELLKICDGGSADGKN